MESNMQGRGFRWKVTMEREGRELFVYPVGHTEDEARARANEIYPKWTVKAAECGGRV